MRSRGNPLCGRAFVRVGAGTHEPDLGVIIRRPGGPPALRTLVTVQLGLADAIHEGVDLLEDFAGIADDQVMPA